MPNETTLKIAVDTLNVYAIEGNEIKDIEDARWIVSNVIVLIDKSNLN